MLKEYFQNLAERDYTANWKPNEGVKVGEWTNIATGFIPWFNRIVDNTALAIEINKGLHSVMKGSLKKIYTETRELAPMCMYHQVSVDVGISGGPAKIKAQKAGGYFAIFQDLYEISAKPASFQKKIQELDEAYVAIISSVTHVRKGLLVIFDEDTASFTLPIGFDYSLEQMHHEPGAINLDFDFNISSSNAGVMVYQAKPDKMLTPFVKIEQTVPTGGLTSRVSRQRKASVPTMSYVMGPQDFADSAPRSVQPTEKYVLKPFSYTDFFETMEL